MQVKIYSCMIIVDFVIIWRHEYMHVPLNETNMALGNVCNTINQLVNGNWRLQLATIKQLTSFV